MKSIQCLQFIFLDPQLSLHLFHSCTSFASFSLDSHFWFIFAFMCSVCICCKHFSCCLFYFFFALSASFVLIYFIFLLFLWSCYTPTSPLPPVFSFFSISSIHSFLLCCSVFFSLSFFACIALYTVLLVLQPSCTLNKYFASG